LINFTVDILALYFAGIISGIKTTVPRLIISSVLGGIFACFVALFDLSAFIRMILTLVYGFLISLIFTKLGTVQNRIKLVSAFLILEISIGGAVTLFYRFLNEILAPILESEIGLENRKALIIALLIALIYFILKVVYLLFFGATKERRVDIELEINDKILSVTALVDSGNLLIDPMNARPVILVKIGALKLIKNASDIEADDNLKTRIRLIPAQGIGGSKILTGLRCDMIRINGSVSNITTIAIDEEEGSFGGYLALAPASVVE
jgi:stage II sporulation protein GA (sporulation sigma-E factor processing peptidase)